LTRGGKGGWNDPDMLQVGNDVVAVVQYIHHTPYTRTPYIIHHTLIQSYTIHHTPYRYPLQPPAVERRQKCSPRRKVGHRYSA
jgi:hypothetical protein